MSQQGLQRAGHVLNTIMQQFPSIAQADQMGVPMRPFVLGIMQRTQVPLSPELGKLVDGLLELIGPTDPFPTPRGQTVDDDALVNS